MRYLLPARLVSSLILLGAATVVFARPAITSAQALNPPPPPFVTCKTTGSGAICSGSYAFGGPGVIAATDNICGFDIAYQTAGTISPTLWYDQSGNLVKEFDRGSITITYSADGRSLTSLDIAYPHFDYADDVVKVTGMEEKDNAFDSANFGRPAAPPDIGVRGDSGSRLDEYQHSGPIRRE